MTDAIIVPLDIWQDPQGDVILVYSEYECSVYFNCWTSSAIPADFIAQLSFERASLVQSYRREFLPYRVARHSGHSYILRIPDSALVRDHTSCRQKHYPNSSRFEHPTPEHYVVVGHDIYHEILAMGFTTTRIPKQSISDHRLLRLIHME
jgi:hypothetical protein